MEKMEKAPAYSEVEVKEIPPTKEVTYTNANTAEKQPIVREVRSSGFGGSSVGKTGQGLCACTCLVICICLCVTVLVICAILGGVFGYWATHCFKDVVVKSEKFVDNLKFPIDEIKIFTSGNVTFSEVQDGVPSLYLAANVSGSKSYVDEINLKVDYVTEVSKVFEFKAQDIWWFCSHTDIESIFDSSNLQNEIDVLLQTSSGDINFNNFNGSIIQKVELRSSSGDIISNTLYTSETIISASSGDIKLKKVESSKIFISSDSGDVNIDSFVSQNLAIVAHSGDVVTSGVLTVSKNGSECLYQITSSSGSVEIDMLDFQSVQNCDVNIRLFSGDAKVTLKNFSGSYSLSTNSGDVTLNGEKYGRTKEGTVSGSSSHSFKIDSSSGDIFVNF